MSQVVWGIDVSTTRIAFATSGGACGSVDLPKGLRGAERLSEARSLMWHFARDFAGTNPPLYVWVEQPAGKPRPHPALIEMVGVTKATLYGMLSTLYRFPVTVREVPVATWKKWGVGYGSATKDDVMAWAKRIGAPGNQDEADALGIAWAGRAMIQGGAT